MRARRRPDTRYARVLLALLLIATSLVPFAGAVPAHAASGTKTLTVEGIVRYDNYSTNSFRDENRWLGYCAQPSKTTPGSGEYPVVSLRDAYQGGSAVGSVAAVLYYSYGGPGYDQSFFPSTWYDGSPMNADSYYAISHILIADRMYWDAEAALTGCSEAFRQYYGYHCQGQQFWVEHVGMGTEANPDGTYMKMIAAWHKMPAAKRNAYIDSCYALVTGDSTQTIVVANPNEPTGWLNVWKRSAEPEITDGNKAYSLEGARFDVFSDRNCRNHEVTLVTNDSGYSRYEDLLPGTYYVRESAPPPGFKLDNSVSEVKIEGMFVTDLTIKNIPVCADSDLILRKVDADSRENAPQGGADLACAVYQFEYYDGTYATADEARASGKPKRIWKMRTDDTGTIDFSRADEQFTHQGRQYKRFFGGHKLYRIDGKVVLPLGTLVIHEIKAPEGYEASSEVFVVNITEGANKQGIVSGDKVVVDKAAGKAVISARESVARGGVQIQKRDLESQGSAPLGSAELDGTRFAITNRSANPVHVAGANYAPGEAICEIEVSQGEAKTANDLLPFGDYGIREVAATDGYLLTDGEEKRFSIDHAGHMVQFADGESAFNQVKRGDLEFVKARESDQARLASIPFRITSLTTGENHIIVTDANGEAKTASNFNPHTVKTNANDDAVSPDGAVDESKLDASAGIWFGLAADGKVTAANDNLGALPYDQYKVEELSVAANEGLQLITLPCVTVTRHGYEIDLGTLDNQASGEVALESAARSARDGGKQVTADIDAVIIDRVSYTGVTLGKNYELSARLYDATDKTFVENDEGPVSATAAFTAKSTSGYAEVVFEGVDLTKHAGHDIVVFETLIDVDSARRAVVEHADAADYAQTLTVVKPRISTAARDAADGDGSISADPSASVIDAVSYVDLAPGGNYIAQARIMVKPADAAGAAAVELEKDGKPIVAEVAFTPAEPAGCIDVAIEGVDVSTLANREIVVFEKLYRVDEKGTRHEIAAHEDIDAVSQTLSIEEPRITTSAADAIDGDKRIVADAEAGVVDHVMLDGVTAGRAYEVEGVLIDKDAFAKLTTQEAFDAAGDAERSAIIEKAAVKDARGTRISAKAAVVPEDSKGSAELTFAFDASKLAACEIVVFETLYADGAAVAKHHDINDAEQTVRFENSRIDTVATCAQTGGHQVMPSESAVVTDTVSYENLIPGKEYRLEGTVMSKQTGKAIEVAGKPVVTTVVFTPESAAGSVEATFCFDSRDFEGQDLVVFETLYRGSIVVAEHKDLQDADQSLYVEVAPRTAAGKPAAPKTGDVPIAPIALTAAALCAAGALVMSWRKTRKEKRRF